MLTGNNLNPRAWSLDLENGLLIQDDANLTHKFEDEVARILEHTQLICTYKQLEKSKITRLLYKTREKNHSLKS